MRPSPTSRWPIRVCAPHSGQTSCTLLAWTEDRTGAGEYTLRVKDLATGALLPDTAARISSSVAWAGDNRTLFYVGKDPKTLREDRVMRHALGEKIAPLGYREDFMMLRYSAQLYLPESEWKRQYVDRGSPR